MNNYKTKERKNFGILTKLTFRDYAEYLNRRGTVLLYEDYRTKNEDDGLECVLRPIRDARPQTHSDLTKATFSVGKKTGKSAYKQTLKYVGIDSRIYDSLETRLDVWDWRELGKLKGKDKVLEWVVKTYGMRIHIEAAPTYLPLENCPVVHRLNYVCVRTAQSDRYLVLERWIAADEKELEELNKKMRSLKAGIKHKKERLKENRAELKTIK
jgi:uncharacterized protein (DUF342 family)